MDRNWTKQPPHPANCDCDWCTEARDAQAARNDSRRKARDRNAERRIARTWGDATLAAGAL